MIPTGQEDPGNLPQIQAYGCNLFTHWSWVESILGHTIVDTPDQVNAEYQKLLAAGKIQDDCTVLDGAGIFALYGISVRQLTDPVSGSPFISPNYMPTEGQIIDLCYHWDAKGFVHFVRGNVDKSVAWDPIVRGGAGSNTVKYGYLHSLRIYELVGGQS